MCAFRISVTSWVQRNKVSPQLHHVTLLSSILVVSKLFASTFDANMTFNLRHIRYFKWVAFCCNDTLKVQLFRTCITIRCSSWVKSKRFPTFLSMRELRGSLSIVNVSCPLRGIFRSWLHFPLQDTTVAKSFFILAGVISYQIALRTNPPVRMPPWRPRQCACLFLCYFSLRHTASVNMLPLHSWKGNETMKNAQILRILRVLTKLFCPLMT